MVMVPSLLVRTHVSYTTPATSMLLPFPAIPGGALGVACDLLPLCFVLAWEVLPAAMPLWGYLFNGWCGIVRSWETLMHGLFALSLPSPTPYNPGL